MILMKHFYSQWQENRTKYFIKDEDDTEEFFNCELLACPEFSNFSHIINDTRFDYYSLYAIPLPPINSTCIPAVGVFQYYNEFANYSVATQRCFLGNGSLAHILSETRTNSLSNFIHQQQNITRVKVAYVGLNETIRNKFRTSANEPIECSLYRAWSPGHPMQKNILRCIALTVEDSWQTFACSKRLPFICEIHVSGPSETGIDFGRKCSVKRDNNVGRVRRKKGRWSFRTFYSLIHIASISIFLCYTIEFDGLVPEQVLQSINLPLGIIWLS